MAKPTFAKMNLKRISEVKTVVIGEQEIEIKQYLPINDKLVLISNVINQAAAQSMNFANPVQVEVFTALETIFAYTNIVFTDKQKEDPAKLFDLLEENNIINQIVEQIPEVEYEFILNGVDNSLESFYNYKNSALGILETISADYSNLNLDATEIQQKLADKDNLVLLKDVMTKLG